MISELALKISKPPDHLQECVGDTGIEPVTSSVSRKRSPTELIALCSARVPNEVETGFEPVYTALQAVASPLGHSTVRLVGLRADDGIRTRDPHLGKVMLYQLSHVRTAPTPVLPGQRVWKTSRPPRTQSNRYPRACRPSAVASVA